MIATDSSAAALALATSNATRLGLANIEFRRGHWCTPLARDRPALIVANPPYVTSGDPHLQRDGVCFEPHGALVAGEDGLDAIRDIAAGAPRHMAASGWLLLEHGAGQGKSVRNLLAQRGFRKVTQYRDYANRERVVCARPPA